MENPTDASQPVAIEVLLKLYETKFMLAKQAEDQRAVMSNFLITIAAVMFAFISQQDFARKTIIISLFTIMLGVFGLFMSAKYGQHYQKNYWEAMFLREQISQLCPTANLSEIDQASRKLNHGRNPVLAKIPTVYLWNILHGAICLIGVLCILISLIQ